jgi:hypothetical protein
MTAYADCPDARFLIEWLTAQSYERLAERGDATHASCVTGVWIFDALRACEERALYYYLIFYARVSGDL